MYTYIQCVYIHIYIYIVAIYIHIFSGFPLVSEDGRGATLLVNSSPVALPAISSLHQG